MPFILVTLHNFTVAICVQNGSGKFKSNVMWYDHLKICTTDWPMWE